MPGSMDGSALLSCTPLWLAGESQGGKWYLQAARGAVGGPHIDDGLCGVVVVGDGAAARVQRVEDGGGNLDQALPMRQQRA